MTHHYNQPGSWWRGRRGARVEAREEGSAWGDAVSSFGPSDRSTKKYQKQNTRRPLMAADWKTYTTTNHKHAYTA
jgi:hypothetical protein